jgi:hypothetical protein
MRASEDIKSCLLLELCEDWYFSYNSSSLKRVALVVSYAKIYKRITNMSNLIIVSFKFKGSSLVTFIYSKQYCYPLHFRSLWSKGENTNHNSKLEQNPILELFNIKLLSLLLVNSVDTCTRFFILLGN